MDETARFGVISILILTVLLFRTYPQVAAIQCYVCQSNVDPKCADPFDNKTLPLTDCDAYPRADLVTRTDFEAVEEKGFSLLFGQPSPAMKPLRATMCRKIRQKVNGEWRTIRGCGYLGPPGDSDDAENHCQVRHGTSDLYMETCACNTRGGCNGATRVIVDIGSFNLMALFVSASTLMCLRSFG